MVMGHAGLEKQGNIVDFHVICLVVQQKFCPHEAKSHDLPQLYNIIPSPSREMENGEKLSH